MLKPWFVRLRRDFNPRQQESGLACRWLKDDAAAHAVAGSGQGWQQRAHSQEPRAQSFTRAVAAGNIAPVLGTW